MPRNEKTPTPLLPTLEAALKAVLDSRDTEQEAASAAADAVTAARSSLAQAEETEKVAETLLARNPGPAMTKKADETRALREKIQLELERAERRATILADALLADDDRVWNAVNALESAATPMIAQVKADYLTRLEAAAAPLQAVLAEGHRLKSALQNAGQFGGILDGYTVPGPRGAVPDDAPTGPAIEVLNSVKRVAAALGSILRDQARRREQARARYEQANPRGVTVRYVDPNADPFGWSPAAQSMVR